MFQTEEQTHQPTVVARRQALVRWRAVRRVDVRAVRALVPHAQHAPAQNAAVARPLHVPAAARVQYALSAGHLPEEQLVVAAVAEQPRLVRRPPNVRHKAAVPLARAHELPLLRAP